MKDFGSVRILNLGAKAPASAFFCLAKLRCSLCHSAVCSTLSKSSNRIKAAAETHQNVTMPSISVLLSSPDLRMASSRDHKAIGEAWAAEVAAIEAQTGRKVLLIKTLFERKAEIGRAHV